LRWEFGKVGALGFERAPEGLPLPVAAFARLGCIDKMTHERGPVRQDRGLDPGFSREWTKIAVIS